jgi:hypothetical protein
MRMRICVPLPIQKINQIKKTITKRITRIFIKYQYLLPFVDTKPTVKVHSKTMLGLVVNCLIGCYEVHTKKNDK